VPAIQGPAGSDFPAFREVYVVSEETAESIDELLESSGFFQWPSIEERGSDKYYWVISVRTPAGRHRVFLWGFFERDDEHDWDVFHPMREFLETPPRDASPADSEAIALSKKLFNLIDEIHEMAQTHGKALIAHHAAQRSP
jgi:hypothetical protein